MEIPSTQRATLKDEEGRERMQTEDDDDQIPIKLKIGFKKGAKESKQLNFCRLAPLRSTQRPKFLLQYCFL